MKVGIIAWSREEIESRSLEAELVRRGHTACRFLPADVTFAPGVAATELTVAGEPAAGIDVFITRFQHSEEGWKHDLEVLSLLQDLDVPFVNDIRSFYTSLSKVVSVNAMTRRGVPLPRTWLARTSDDVLRVVEAEGRVVLKPSNSGRGIDVTLLENDAAAPGVVSGLLAKHGVLLVQEYIDHPQGDMRINVVGDRVVSGYRRVRTEGMDFRANISLGAKAVPVELTPRLAEVAIMAAKAAGLDVAGVDIVEHAGDYVIFEVNYAPAWYFMPDADQEAMAAAICDLALAKGGNSHDR